MEKFTVRRKYKGDDTVRYTTVNTDSYDRAVEIVKVGDSVIILDSNKE